MSTVTDPHRKALSAKIHVAKKQLGLDEVTYRAMVERVTGKSSTKDAVTSKLIDLVKELEAKGFRNTSTFHPSSKPDVRKIYALWGELKRLDALDNPTKAALRAFCARMAATGTATTDPEFLTPAQCRQVIEGLKAWVDRKTSR
ncbi:regulatory protein GemA [Telmatospirillum sp.]|uniref:gp16 family protein n=1 Tax=Telmatospirillum sp. TaxID=2079197 RepID=UPI00284CC155|nr:regulatory protein GemA [Telmatospirillum sp.]MDR3437161.1 regulatory protein GemA [Telmatospirillum sp.]